MSSDKREEPVIIKKIKKGGHGGHHGGAWKVAYADFVTAMMAFFLVMWILGLSESSKKSVASYFDKPGAFSFTTGKALPVGVSSTQKATYKYDNSPSNYNNFTERGGPSDFEENPRLADLDSNQRAEMIEALKDSVVAAKAMEQRKEDVGKFIDSVLNETPSLKELSESIKIRLDEEGLRIDLLETRENLFFTVGSANLTKEAIGLLKQLAVELGKTSNNLRVEGHTDSRPYPASATYSNWELATNRANAARRILEANGLWAGQVSSVTGFSDRKLYNKENPFDVTNRRVSILLEYLKADNFMGEKQQ